VRLFSYRVLRAFRSRFPPFFRVRAGAFFLSCEPSLLETFCFTPSSGPARGRFLGSSLLRFCERRELSGKEVQASFRYHSCRSQTETFSLRSAFSPSFPPRGEASVFLKKSPPFLGIPPGRLLFAAPLIFHNLVTLLNACPFLPDNRWGPGVSRATRR